MNQPLIRNALPSLPLFTVAEKGIMQSKPSNYTSQYVTSSWPLMDHYGFLLAFLI
jgi:hypothetical protein